MPWVKIDDAMPDHPKLAEVGPLGIALQVAALCYSNRFQTRGHISWRVLERLLNWQNIAEYEDKDVDSNGVISFALHVYPWNVARKLVEAGVWEEHPNGFWIHDYEEYQPSPEEVMDLKQKRQEAGRLGGKASALARQFARESQANEANGEAKSNPVPGPVPEPVEIQSQHLARENAAQEEDAFFPKRMNGLNDMQEYLIERLHTLDAKWKRVTFGGLNKLRNEYSGPIVTMALQRAWESKPAVNGSAYGLLAAICRTVAEEGA